MEYREGREFPIYKNPSRGEAMKLFSRSKTKILRGFTSGNDFYLWEYSVLHSSAQDALELQNVHLNLEYYVYLIKGKPTLRKKRDEDLIPIISLKSNSLGRLLENFPNAHIFKDPRDPELLYIYLFLL